MHELKIYIKMKKYFIMLFAFSAMLIMSCGNPEVKTVDTDSVYVDTTLVDSVESDSLIVD